MYLLHTYADRFVLDVDGSMSGLHDGAPTESLIIDRATGAMARSGKTAPRPTHGAAFSERIDGVVGIIQSETTHECTKEHMSSTEEQEKKLRSDLCCSL